MTLLTCYLQHYVTPVLILHLLNPSAMGKLVKLPLSDTLKDPLIQAMPNYVSPAFSEYRSCTVSRVFLFLVCVGIKKKCHLCCLLLGYLYSLISNYSFLYRL